MRVQNYRTENAEVDGGISRWDGEKQGWVARVGWWQFGGNAKAAGKPGGPH